MTTRQRLDALKEFEVAVDKATQVFIFNTQAELRREIERIKADMLQRLGQEAYDNQLK